MSKCSSPLARLLLMSAAALYPLCYLFIRGLPGIFPESGRIENEGFGWLLLGCGVLFLALYVLLLLRDRRVYHLPVKILLPAAVLCISLLPYMFDRLDLSFIEPSRGSDHWLFGFLLLLLALLVAWVEYARWAKRHGA